MDIVKIFSSQTLSDRSRLPGSSLILSEEDIETAKRKIAYLDAVYRAIDLQNGGKSSRKLIKRILLEVGEERGEEPPSVDRYYVWAKADKEGRHFDRVLALAPAVRKGNTRSPFGPRVEEMLRQACIDAYSMSEGTWLSVKARAFFFCSKEGSYPDLAPLFITESRSVISDRTFQRRFATMLDHYTRDFLRFGSAYAERVHATYLRTALPTAPLDIVDVDHTELDVVVIDDEYPILFGRPDLIVFRDRYSGIPLGFDVCFGAPRWDTFLGAFHNACFPKRPADLPEGLSYPWHGRPTKLGVDNALHFLGKDIQNASIQLGFQIVEYRAGHPWEKGALEHLFHVTNRGLVHQLPGSTTGSIELRNSFDPEKGKAVPTLTLAELKGFLATYFADIYSRKPTTGLGDIALFQGIPAERWEKGIHKAQR